MRMRAMMLERQGRQNISAEGWRQRPAERQRKNKMSYDGMTSMLIAQNPQERGRR